MNVSWVCAPFCHVKDGWHTFLSCQGALLLDITKVFFAIHRSLSIWDDGANDKRGSGIQTLACDAFDSVESFFPRRLFDLNSTVDCPDSCPFFISEDRVPVFIVSWCTGPKFVNPKHHHRSLLGRLTSTRVRFVQQDTRAANALIFLNQLAVQVVVTSLARMIRVVTTLGSGALRSQASAHQLVLGALTLTTCVIILFLTDLSHLRYLSKNRLSLWCLASFYTARTLS